MTILDPIKDLFGVRSEIFWGTDECVQGWSGDFQTLGRESQYRELGWSTLYISIGRSRRDRRLLRLTEALPYITNVPLDLTTSKSSSNESFPTPSYTAWTPLPSVRERTFLTFSSDESVVRRTWCAPFCFASSAFSWLEVVAITFAPL